MLCVYKFPEERGGKGKDKRQHLAMLSASQSTFYTMAIIPQSVYGEEKVHTRS